MPQKRADVLRAGRDIACGVAQTAKEMHNAELVNSCISALLKTIKGNLNLGMHDHCSEYILHTQMCFCAHSSHRLMHLVTRWSSIAKLTL